MNVERTHQDGELIFTITVGRDELQAAKRKAAKKLARELRVPGFRPGKAPYQVIVRYLGGEQALLHEVVEENFVPWITKALEPYSEDIFSMDLIDEPQIEGLDGQSDEITITIKVPAEPRVTLGDVSTIEVDTSAEEREREKQSEVEKHIDRVLSLLREQHATWIPTSGPAEYGDLVTVDIQGRLLTGDVVIDEENVEVRLERDEEEEDEEEAQPSSPILVAGQETPASPPERFWSHVVGMSAGPNQGVQHRVS
ncbi:MAG: trigger factor [Ardenticatenia bacterium]|nr:trigger factor [Ardenticatenia bacterium]